METFVILVTQDELEHMQSTVLQQESGEDGIYKSDYTSRVYIVLCYMEESFDHIEEDEIKLETNDPRVVRQICNVKSEDRISACKLRIRLKLI